MDEVQLELIPPTPLGEGKQASLPERLPPIGQSLLGLLGRDDFLQLVQSFGGENLYVAQSADRSQIAEHLSPEGLERLVAEYGGTHIRVPRLRRRGRRRGLSLEALQRRNAAIVEQWGRSSVRALVEQFGLTEQRLFEIYRQAREET